MSMEDDALDRSLSALTAELSGFQPPPAVDRAIAAAITRAERAGRAPARRLRQTWLAWAAPIVVAASVATLAWTLRSTPKVASDETVVATAAGTEFIPIVPVADIAGTHGAYVVSTEMPRTMLARFGLPVSPVRAAEPVQSELLVRADGTVLAVRFLE